jgi:hypothetical protein
MIHSNINTLSMTNSNIDTLSIVHSNINTLSMIYSNIDELSMVHSNINTLSMIYSNIYTLSTQNAEEPKITKQKNNQSVDSNVNTSSTQDTEGAKMAALLNAYINEEFSNDDAKIGTVAATNDLIDKGCYFYPTLEENQWFLLGIYNHLKYSVSKEDLKKYIETEDWSALNVLYSYQEVADRTSI